MSTSEIDELVLFAKRFREERERLGFENQKSLGWKLNVDVKTIGKYERGETSPTTAQIIRFRELGADLHYLFSGVRKSIVESLEKAHGEHINRLVDTIVQCELCEDDAALLEALARRLGR